MFLVVRIVVAIRLGLPAAESQGRGVVSADGGGEIVTRPLLAPGARGQRPKFEGPQVGVPCRLCAVRESLSKGSACGVAVADVICLWEAWGVAHRGLLLGIGCGDWTRGLNRSRCGS